MRQIMVVFILAMSSTCFAGPMDVQTLCNQFERDVLAKQDVDLSKAVAVKIFDRKIAIPNGFVLNEFHDEYVVFLRFANGTVPEGSISFGKFKPDSKLDEFIEKNANSICKTSDENIFIMLRKDTFGVDKKIFYTIRVFDDFEYFSITGDIQGLWQELLSMQGRETVN